MFDPVKILITGAQGFIARNLRQHLAERNEVDVVCFDRSNHVSELREKLQDVDFVFHLAGVNRPQDPSDFTAGNRDLTRALCEAATSVAEIAGKKIPILLTSSIQACKDNLYGRSKRGAEDAVFAVAQSHGLPVHVFRLPNVFGKWCRPNYNSAVATFCHNIARDLRVEIRDPSAPLTLVYIDDVVETFVRLMDGDTTIGHANGFVSVTPQYNTTVGEVVSLIRRFRESRGTLTMERVGTGFARALYSTYVSYLPVSEFGYALKRHEDHRGVFVEMLKTQDCGQFSYFTAHPGVTRGGHYHHAKTEKFLVVKGKARFKFRHIQTGETYELITDDERAEVVETVPGWTHDVTNIGDHDMIVMLWANETFDHLRPDTYACPV
jgi:UDP-2-acetamido-2,6-beta-L-arabino-hexul-4-ose reductase